jgi:tetratricopeptide (TPR) repeat protein
MTDAGRTAMTRFVGELKRLRARAGEPSLNRLVALTAELPHPLPRSTISDKLNARSLPEWEFVASFVTACAAHAETPLPPDMVDLTRWAERHLAMLRAVDSAHAADRLAASARAELDRRVKPRQLPAAPQHFAGREAELAVLDQIAELGVVSAIGGTAGIGKTTLAVQWAWRAADRFPDGQLYVNLRGYGPDAPLTPAEAVRGFLEAFALPPKEIPTTADGQTGLYRSLLAGKRMLVLLDNARDAEQVRPLLPGSPGCLTLVTSRDRLAGLVATEGAHPVPLDLLTPSEARTMLAERVGPDRVLAEPPAVDRIIAVCAGLPLALAIVAARAALQPDFSLADLAGELDLPRTVFSWSYRGLDAEVARLFRLLGRHPGPDIGVAAAAGLAGVPVGEARRLLRVLADASLLTEHRPGRFTCHDLLRAYAAELADSPDEVRTAMHRMFDHYLRTADRAAHLLDPYRAEFELPAPAGAEPVEIAEVDGALAWFAAEHRVLLAAVTGELGFDTHVQGLARALSAYLYRAGYWAEWVTAAEAALRAARRGGDRGEQAYAHRGLARVYLRVGREEAALAQLRQALDRYVALGDQVGQGHTHLNLAEVYDQFDQNAAALRHSLLALDGYRAADHPAGQAKASNSVGWCLSQQGEYAEAVGYCHEALDLQLELGDREGAADTLDTLGHAYHRLGDHEQARTCYGHAAEAYRETGNRPEEGMTLDHLGDVAAAAGALPEARDAWRRAAELLAQVGPAEQVEAIHAKLDHADRGMSSGTDHVHENATRHV